MKILFVLYFALVAVAFIYVMASLIPAMSLHVDFIRASVC